jgi:flagellar biosynthesis protein FlhG
MRSAPKAISHTDNTIVSKVGHVMSKSPTIIPVAGGKGGVGKTLFAANLAVALAQLGCETVVVDLDLGNSNLHSLLGMANRFPGIGDYLRIGEGSLESFLVDTDIPRLRLLPGDGRMPFMANITHHQKKRLIAGLQALPGDYVILDLGAGCALHTLDFFTMVDRGMILSSPEYPALMSALVFLKNMILRKIENSLRQDVELTDLVNRMYVQPMNGPQVTVESLAQLASESDPEAGRRIREVCARYRPRMIFNMGDHPDDLTVLETIDRSIRQILSIEVDYFGFVFADPAVRESIRKGMALLVSHPESRPARAISHIAHRVTRYWNLPIPNSAELLTAHTRKAFDEAQADPGSRSRP